MTSLSQHGIVFGLAGICAGLVAGWIVGRSQATPATRPPIAAPAESAPPPPPQARPLDVARAADLERRAARAPRDAAVRVELANLYYDARRFDQAVIWYQAALALAPNDVNASTDLAVAFYELGDASRALAQIDQSLRIDPAHLPTLLNQGIIRAFGQQDFAGAAQSWEQVVSLAPASDEARRARQGLDGLRSMTGSSPAPAPAPPSGGKRGDDGR
jgi:cytochrome c-type biogenesis protein CcmH/NrfG